MLVIKHIPVYYGKKPTIFKKYQYFSDIDNIYLFKGG